MAGFGLFWTGLIDSGFLFAFPRCALKSEPCQQTLSCCCFYTGPVFTDIFAGDALRNLKTFFSERDYIMSEGQTND